MSNFTKSAYTMEIIIKLISYSLLTNVYVICSLWDDKVKKLKSKYENMFQNTQLPEKKKEWEFQEENWLEYPGTDKAKLYQLSSQWINYYKYIVNMRDGITKGSPLPAELIMIYEGMSLQIKCGICISPGNKKDIQWLYTKNDTSHFGPLEPRENVLMDEPSVLKIYHANAEDHGIYTCQIGASFGVVTFLETVGNEETYTVVKPLTATKSKHAASNVTLPDLKLIIFSKWNEWSRCSECNKVGRRRRVGICYLVRDTQAQTTTNIFQIPYNIMKTTMEIISAFPGGVPCRSRYLPKEITEHPKIKSRPSEIMIGLCKPKCKESGLFIVKTADGKVLEIANNTAGEYSMLQGLPPPVPQPRRLILFKEQGENVKLLCPGITFTDVPVKWSIGTKNVVPYEMQIQSSGLMRISARDEMVIDSLRISDSNIYSCWQNGDLVGSIKLIVSKSYKLCYYDHHVMLMGLVVITAVALKIAVNAMKIHRTRVNFR